MDIDSNCVLVATTSVRCVIVVAQGSSTPATVLSIIYLGFVPNVGGTVLTTIVPCATTMAAAALVNYNEKPNKFNELNFKR